jgi:AcrR family transcriptional regulator
MALYNHFGSKRALQAAVAVHVISAAQFDGGHANWREQVHHCFETLRNLCLRHPALAELLEVEGVAPATVFASMEVTIRALKEAGLDDLASMRTRFLLVGFTLSQAAYQSKGPMPSLDPSEQIYAAHRRAR